jgi:ligand-binding SRPBCC domain-containing protein
MYYLERTISLNTTMEKAWSFFSDPRNLAFITPPEMDFEIKSKPGPGEFYPGMHIEYVVRPFAGIPIRWVSEIQEIEEKKYFKDIQIVGPYAKWVHRHEFREVAGGVEMKDIVDYEIPYGWVGRIMHRLFIRKKLEDIFDYRNQKIRFLFQKQKPVGIPAVHSLQSTARKPEARN